MLSSWRPGLRPLPGWALGVGISSSSSGVGWGLLSAHCRKRQKRAGELRCRVNARLPPWQTDHAASRRPRADKIPGGYVVRDASGQATAYVYSRQDPTRPRRWPQSYGVIRRGTPPAAVLERPRGPIRWISDTRMVKLDDQLREALSEVGS
jgi:hypothetical protein